MISFQEFCEIAFNGPPPSFEPFAWRKDLVKNKKIEDLKKGIDELNPIGFLKKYTNGESDPLYSLISKGFSWRDSATPEELNRLKQIASTIIKASEDSQEVQTARNLLNSLDG